MDDLRTIEEPRIRRIERLWREREEVSQALLATVYGAQPGQLIGLLQEHGWTRDGETETVTGWLSPDGTQSVLCPMCPWMSDYADAAWRVVEAVLGGGR